MKNVDFHGYVGLPEGMYFPMFWKKTNTSPVQKGSTSIGRSSPAQDKWWSSLKQHMCLNGNNNSIINRVEHKQSLWIQIVGY